MITTRYDVYPFIIIIDADTCHTHIITIKLYYLQYETGVASEWDGNGMECVKFVLNSRICRIRLIVIATIARNHRNRYTQYVSGPCCSAFISFDSVFCVLFGIFVDSFGSSNRTING